MTETIKSILKTSVLFLSGSFLLFSCEAEADDLGSQFFDDTAAKGITKSFDVIAYNISNQDSIRTDATRITSATLGAFKEGQFGMQRSSYVTQARLSNYNPSFGTNAVIDSVVLEVRPVFPVDSVKTTTDEEYIFPEGNVKAKRVVSTYPIRLYGDESATMTLNVHEVTDFLGASSDKVSSRKAVGTGALLGSKTIKGTVSAIDVTKDEDGSALYKREARIRVPLDKTYFANKIFAKEGQAELSDASNFIRYFKGVKLSVAESTGFIMNITPAETQIIIYYSNELTTDGKTERRKTTFPLALGTENARFNLIEADRAGTPSLAYNGTSSPNIQTGDPLLYPQGMGGANVGIRLSNESLSQIRELYKENKINILSAKVRLYTDVSSWNNDLTKPNMFTASYYNPSTGKADLSTFLKEVSAFSGLGALFNLVKATDLDKNPAYYDLTITQTLKDIIEKSDEVQDISLAVGDYEINNSNGSLLGPSFTSRAYTPYRVVLVGSNPSSAKRAQLNIIYSTK
ncbi:DUF4270 domain-containing protein [Chryseobacterium sp. A301]